MGNSQSSDKRPVSSSSGHCSSHTEEEILRGLLERFRNLTSEGCYQAAQQVMASESKEDFIISLQCLMVHLIEAKTAGPATPVMKQVKVFLLITARTFGAHQQILDQLNAQGPRVTPTDDPQECEVILLFCPIQSRIGSDVDAAVRKISVPDKPVVLILMHHTFDPNEVLDKTCWSEKYPCIKQEVRVLFHQSQKGLLDCPRNQEAIQTLQSLCDQYMKRNKQGEKILQTSSSNMEEQQHETTGGMVNNS